MPKHPKSDKKRRYVNIFNELGADWEAIVKARDTDREIEFIGSVLSRKGLTLDLCCGTGRHSVILCQKGWNIIGMDLSKNLLNIAKLRMKEEGADFPMVRADMRYFPFKDHVFNSVMNMFTSFGYLQSENEDMKCLLEIHRALNENGVFLLDLYNKDHLVKIFKEREWAEYEPFFMLEKRSLDLQKSRLISQWTFIRKGTGEITSIEHNLRLYSFAQVEKLLRTAGLAVREVYGGYEKQRFGPDNSRMILLTKKNSSEPSAVTNGVLLTTVKSEL